LIWCQTGILVAIAMPVFWNQQTNLLGWNSPSVGKKKAWDRNMPRHYYMQKEVFMMATLYKVCPVNWYITPCDILFTEIMFSQIWNRTINFIQLAIQQNFDSFTTYKLSKLVESIIYESYEFCLFVSPHRACILGSTFVGQSLTSRQIIMETIK
jgi:hypothetical protein